MSDLRLDHIDSAIAELVSIANRYKDFAAHWEQHERIDNCLNSAKLARSAMENVRQALAERPAPRTTDDHRAAESCYCAACRMPPCSWCTSPDREHDS